MDKIENTANNVQKWKKINMKKLWFTKDVN